MAVFKSYEEGLQGILEDLEAFKEQLDKLGGPFAAAKRGAKKGRSNKVFIDFSDTINENDCGAITNLLKDWWRIPVFPEEYALSDVWAETWILIIEGPDWEDSIKQRESYIQREKLVVPALENQVLRGFHIGATYPKERTAGIEDYHRDLCFVDWAGCSSMANEVLNKYKRYSGELWKKAKKGFEDWKSEYRNLPFLTWEGILEELTDPNTEVWDNAAAKITAWYACHEMCHGAFRSANDLPSFPFPTNIPSLQILLMYTEAGRSVHKKGKGKEGTKFNFVDFYESFGKKSWTESK